MSISLESLLAAVDTARDEAIALTQELVRIPTVNTGVMPTGNETPAAAMLAGVLARDGIAAEILESAPQRGNLIARLSGSGAGPSLLLMGHLDVVPVEDDAQWRYPPFSAELAEGRIWGRGAADMKSTVAAEVLVLLILQRSKVRLKGDVILLAAADEEAGGEFGAAWLAREHPGKIRAKFAVNEGGGHPLRHEGLLTYPINVGEKGRLEVRITVTGRGYHASAPWMAENAILLAQPILNRLTAYEPEISTDAELFTHVGVAIRHDGAMTPENIDTVIASLWDRDRQLGSWLRAASRMTLAPTMIRAGVKSNSIAESCLITCDVRTLPWQDEAYVSGELDRMLEGLPGVTYEMVTTAVPSASPYDSALAEALRQATRVAVGRDDIAFLPGLTTGFTDSRSVRPLGTIAYGFTPAHPHSDPAKDGAHNINESASVDDLMTTARAYMGLAWNLLVDPERST